MGEPIVFVPGHLCTHALYAPQISAFADRPILVANNRDDTSIEAIALRLLAEGPERFNLIGLSMGGYIALEVMRRAPERVARLALLNTSARADTEEQKNKRRALIKVAKTKSFARIPDLFFPGFVHEKNESNADLKAIVREMAFETGPEAFIRQATANGNRIDSRPALADISCPVLVLSGDGDRQIAPELSVEIHQHIPQSDLVLLEACGHLSTLEAPDQVTGALRQFLTRP